MAVSKKKMEANHKWDSENYDSMLIRLPKGSKELIQSTGMSLNGFMNKAFKEYCEKNNYKLEKDGN